MKRVFLCRAWGLSYFVPPYVDKVAEGFEGEPMITILGPHDRGSKVAPLKSQIMQKLANDFGG